MKVRYSLTGAVAVALVVGAASASAQADTTRRTTTSQQRVRVTKESAGEVVRRDSAFIRDSVARTGSVTRAGSVMRTDTTRRDSVMSTDTTRRDSVSRMETMRRDSVTRADSVAGLERARVDSVARDSSARADSIMRATPPAPPAATTDTIRNPTLPMMTSDSYGTRRGGLYFGLGGGPNIPTGAVEDVYKTGFNVTLPIGWQPMNSPFGLRLDLGYSRFNGRSVAEGGLTSQADDPNIWSATANATLDVIRWGESRRGALYLVGGGGVFRFTDFYNSDGSDNEPGSAFKGEPITKGGLTGGAGLAFPIGGTSFFVESRYTTADTDGTNTKWVPVIIGLKWR